MTLVKTPLWVNGMQPRGNTLNNSLDQESWWRLGNPKLKLQKPFVDSSSEVFDLLFLRSEWFSFCIRKAHKGAAVGSWRLYSACWCGQTQRSDGEVARPLCFLQQNLPFCHSEMITILLLLISLPHLWWLSITYYDIRKHKCYLVCMVCSSLFLIFPIISIYSVEESTCMGNSVS